jgi:hypothetical protein
MVLGRLVFGYGLVAAGVTGICTYDDVQNMKKVGTSVGTYYDIMKIAKERALTTGFTWPILLARRLGDTHKPP